MGKTKHVIMGCLVITSCVFATLIGCASENNSDGGSAGSGGAGGSGGGGGGGSEAFTSKSGTTALAPDQSWFASANRDSGSVSVFVFGSSLALDEASTFTISLGNKASEVSSLVAGHDSTYLLATLKYDQKVCRVTIDGGPAQTPECVATGSEPVGVVTNEDGTLIYVSNMVDGSVTVLSDTLADVAELDFSDANGETQVHPFALLYRKESNATGNIYVTDFFAEAAPGTQQGEDNSRRGVVYKMAAEATSVSDANKIILPPLDDTGFRIPTGDPLCPEGTGPGCEDDTSGAFPNQLSSISFHEGRIFVLSTCASPRGDLRFNMNLHSCVHVIDAATDGEIPALRTNIQERIKQQAPGDDKLFCTVPTDMACVAETDFCYVTCGSSDLVMRLDFNGFTDTSAIVAGLTSPKNLPTGKFPTGISIVSGVGDKLALVNNENSRSVSTIDLQSQAKVGDFQTAALPTEGSVEERLLRGKDFFYTGRGRWSDGRWSSCVGCHPAGLTDNVTWHFPTGPRQTVSMDGSFSKENVTADSLGNKHNFANIVAALDSEEFPQRIFNWTSVRDEVADFELNTRGVSGGLGAIVDGDGNRIDLTGANAAQDALIEGGIGANQNNNGSTEALITALNTNTDWNDITDWVKTIRSPRAKTNPLGDIAAGKVLFESEYKCQSCHGGGSWTVGLRYYTPTLNDDTNTSAESVALRSLLLSNLTEGKTPQVVAVLPVHDTNSFCEADADCATFAPVDGVCDIELNLCRTPWLANEFYASESPRPIDEHACVIRDVGTYESTDSASGALELRKNMAAPAQGEAGFNTPSILNSQLGAPYLHNGQYETLAEFLVDGSGVSHIGLTNAVASINSDQARDLVAYILSIDGATQTQDIAAADRICPDIQ